MPEARTVVKFPGHSTLVKGMSVPDVEHLVTEARQDGEEFVYIQNTQFGDNGVAIDPRKVEAIYADTR